MRKHAKTLAVLLFSLFLLFDSTLVSQTHWTTQRQSSISTKPLNEQAYDEARKFWASRMVKCGDSYYWKTSSRAIKPELMQAKTFDFTLVSRPVTEADRLNGITWKGSTQGRFSVYRYYKPGEGWGRWFQGPSSTIGPASSESNIIRKGGQWSVNDHFTTMAGSMFAVTCDYVRDPEASQQRAQEQAQAAQQNQVDLQMYREAESLGLTFSRNPAPPLDMLRSAYKFRVNRRFLHGFYFAPAGGWLILSDGHATSCCLPRGAQAKLDELKYGIRDAAFTSNGGWLVGREDSGSHQVTWWSENIPAQVIETLSTFNNNDTRYGAWSTHVDSLDIRSQDEWVIAFHRSRWSQDFEYKWAGTGLPYQLQETLNAITTQKRQVTQVAFAPNGGWVVLYGGKCFQAADVPQELTDKLTDLSRQPRKVFRVAFAPNGSWVVFADDNGDYRVDDTCVDLQRDPPPRLKLNTGPNITAGNQDRYSIRMFNCDDRCRILVNDRVVTEAGYKTDTGWIDVTSELRAGQNRFRFQVINNGEGITYSFVVRKNGATVFDKSCGTSGVAGCENREFPAGVARELTYDVLRQ